MNFINTTFAHGNGPYARIVEWAIEINNVRENRGLPRLPIVVPLVYPGRQEKIMKEEITENVSENFLGRHPEEILLDSKQGELLAKLMFRGEDYSENLRFLVEHYEGVEENMQRHLEGKRKVETLEGEIREIDMRDCEFQLGLNNRMQTGITTQFYTAGGAGPFDEILERSLVDSEVKLDKDSMKAAIPIAKRMINNQKIIFLNIPGVFSYDNSRIKRSKEIFTPPFIHPAKPDETELPGKGIYLLMTGIDGIRESGMYDAIADLDMQIYAPNFSIRSLPIRIRDKVVSLAPSKITNPNIVAQYARGGWSSVWRSHMSEKGFLTSPYFEKDDPEMLFNEKGIVKLGLGAVIHDNPKKALEESIRLSEKVGNYNKELIKSYGTLDGIKYSAEKVVNFLQKSKE